MVQTRTPTRKWNGAEDRALLDLAAQAGDQVAGRWASIARDMETRFPGRRAYTPMSCSAHYKSVHCDGYGGHYWTRQERQTLRILCQDQDDADIDWADVAHQMQLIFNFSGKFKVDYVRKRFRSMITGAASNHATPRRPSQNTAADPDVKRRRSGTDAPIVLDGERISLSPLDDSVTVKCDAAAPSPSNGSVASRGPMPTKSTRDSGHWPKGVDAVMSPRRSVVGKSPCDRSAVGDGDTAAPPTCDDNTLWLVKELVAEHQLALRAFDDLQRATRPDLLNDVVRRLALAPSLSDADCDVLVQWSLASDPGNAVQWLQYAQRCDIADRWRWAVVVPHHTLYMIQQIDAGRLAIVSDTARAEMDRLRARLQREHLQHHSRLFRLVAAAANKSPLLAKAT